MNPYIIRVNHQSGAQWRLFYAGSNENGTHRIALATAPVTGPTPRGANWTRHGVVLGVGAPGSFNSIWSVLPLVHKFGNVWHLYFSGRSDGCPYEKNATVLQVPQNNVECLFFIFFFSKLLVHWQMWRPPVGSLHPSAPSSGGWGGHRPG